jgi:hypothetical protein
MMVLWAGRLGSFLLQVGVLDFGLSRLGSGRSEGGRWGGWSDTDCVCRGSGSTALIIASTISRLNRSCSPLRGMWSPALPFPDSPPWPSVSTYLHLAVSRFSVTLCPPSPTPSRERIELIASKDGPSNLDHDRRSPCNPHQLYPAFGPPRSGLERPLGSRHLGRRTGIRNHR